jgi:UDP-N-acetylglucosamine 4,6-dehydratase
VCSSDLARAIAPEAEIDVVGIRPGEKLHEEMISEDDARRSYAFDDHYVIAPLLAGWGGTEPWVNGKKLSDGFAYRSDTNDQWLDGEELARLVEEQ